MLAATTAADSGTRGLLSCALDDEEENAWPRASAPRSCHSSGVDVLTRLTRNTSEDE